MDAMNGDKTPPHRSPALVFKLPGITLVGGAALLALFAFGADYDAYRRKSWVLIPGLL